MHVGVYKVCIRVHKVYKCMLECTKCTLEVLECTKCTRCTLECIKHTLECTDARWSVLSLQSVSGAL